MMQTATGAADLTFGRREMANNGGDNFSICAIADSG
jgi:hypothetical protein